MLDANKDGYTVVFGLATEDKISLIEMSAFQILKCAPSVHHMVLQTSEYYS